MATSLIKNIILITLLVGPRTNHIKILIKLTAIFMCLSGVDKVVISWGTVKVQSRCVQKVEEFEMKQLDC